MTEHEEVLQRLARIEARQRAYDMHDPDCPTFLTQQFQRRTDAYLTPQKCRCWLSRDDE